MSHEEDDTLVARVLAGERTAFNLLVLRYQDGVARLARRLLGPTVDAQDVVQEAVLLAYLGLATLREPHRFGAWLHGIAANLARRALRRRRLLSLDALHQSAPQSSLWLDGAPDPEERQLARELHDAIVTAIGELSPGNRAVVIGFYLAGHSYAELAALLGVPVSTVKGRLFKGRRQLRGVLGPLARDVLKPDKRSRKELAMDTAELVEVRVDSIHTGLEPEAGRVVVLRPEGTDRALPIWIGGFEADAIAHAVQGDIPIRPMTHDLTVRLLDALGGRVERVVINKLVDETFFAEILLRRNGETQIIDARPSDAIALAVRSSTPIFVASAVLDASGIEATPEDLPQVLEQKTRERQEARGSQPDLAARLWVSPTAANPDEPE